MRGTPYTMRELMLIDKWGRAGCSVGMIAGMLGRSSGGVKYHMKKMGVYERASKLGRVPSFSCDDRIRELYSLGRCTSAIAGELGLKYNDVYMRLKTLGLKPRAGRCTHGHESVAR